MVRISATEEQVLRVTAAPERAYALFSRPDKLSQALASVERCEVLTEGRVRWVLKEKVDRGVRFQADYVVAYEGDGREHVRWRFVEGNMRNEGDVRITAVAGGSEIRYRETAEPELPITPLMARLLKPLVVRELRREIDAFLGRVREQLSS